MLTTRLCRDRMAVDEPRCDALRRENDVLLKKMLKMKEEQRVRTEEFEAAKMEKHAVLNRKVRNTCTLPIHTSLSI